MIEIHRYLLEVVKADGAEGFLVLEEDSEERALDRAMSYGAVMVKTIEALKTLIIQ